MIRLEQYPRAIRALQRLIVHAKAQAYEAGEISIAELLNDIEMLPEFLGDEDDRTCDFVEMLEGIARMNPSCRYIVDEYLRVSTVAL